MATTPTLVIIHGWSDTHRSFTRLGNELVREGIVPRVAHVRLGDYVSLDDDVTFDDLTQALQTAWKAQGLPTTSRSVNIVVHSTGALVVRHWMTTYFKPSTNPIHRLLMLAPANFGSPLAHKGRSFLGRVIKGFKSERRFHTGTDILKGLELASPFSWELALRDRFSTETWYGPGRVLCTVLVGTSGYSGISAAANENGTDGTVRVSTAHLDPVRVTLDFVADPQKPRIAFEPANGITAFSRVPDDNHSTLAMKDGGPKHARAREFITRALTVGDAGFPAWVQELEEYSLRAREAGADRPFTQAYQNTVIRLTDNVGAFVDDYFVEVFAKIADGATVDQQLTRVIQERILGKVHTYGANPAFRSLLFNTTTLHELVQRANRALYVSVMAMPDIGKTKTVGYSTVGWDDIGSMKLAKARLEQFFQPDRTVLVDMTIRREQTDKVFRFVPL
jgi:pimeloyl-ACP methyl ester carboxylesterase